MIAYDPAEWHDLFVATAGAGAALAGLVVVAVSINVDRILNYAGLPERALAALLMLLGVVVVSVVGLMPGQSQTALGVELVVVGLGVTAAVGWMLVRSQAETEPHLARRLANVSLSALGTIPILIGGLSILADTGGGLYWVVAAVVFAIVGSVLNAWVLLVEILR